MNEKIKEEYLFMLAEKLRKAFIDIKYLVVLYRVEENLIKVSLFYSLDNNTAKLFIEKGLDILKGDWKGEIGDVGDVALFTNKSLDFEARNYYLSQLLK